ncbi:MAG: hypothetical protein Fur0010_27210 [Bdellovibrio sp.]
MHSQLFKTPYFNLEVKSNQSELIQRISYDLNMLTQKTGGDLNLRVEVFIGESAPLLLKGSRFYFLTRKAKIYQREMMRRIVYRDGAQIEFDYRNEAASVWAPTIDRAHDLSLQIIQSRVGKYLDKMGLHRIHACAIEYKDQAMFMMMPIGGGKSSLLLELLKNPDVKLISDDTPLLDHAGTLHAYPLRIGIASKPDGMNNFELPTLTRLDYGTKYLISTPFINNSISWESEKYYAIIGSPGYESSLTVVKGQVLFYRLVKEMVIGLGVPQIVELYLEFSFIDFLRILRILGSRMFLMLKLLLKTKKYKLVRGPSNQKNAELIINLLDKAKTT